MVLHESLELLVDEYVEFAVDFLNVSHNISNTFSVGHIQYNTVMSYRAYFSPK
jgi:hypothetical protein